MPDATLRSPMQLLAPDFLQQNMSDRWNILATLADGPRLKFVSNHFKTTDAGSHAFALTSSFPADRLRRATLLFHLAADGQCLLPIL